MVIMRWAIQDWYQTIGLSFTQHVKGGASIVTTSPGMTATTSVQNFRLVCGRRRQSWPSRRKRRQNGKQNSMKNIRHWSVSMGLHWHKGRRSGIEQQNCDCGLEYVTGMWDWGCSPASSKGSRTETSSWHSYSGFLTKSRDLLRRHGDDAWHAGQQGGTWCSITFHNESVCVCVCVCVKPPDYETLCFAYVQCSMLYGCMCCVLLGSCMCCMLLGSCMCCMMCWHQIIMAALVCRFVCRKVECRRCVKLPQGMLVRLSRLWY